MDERFNVSALAKAAGVNLQTLRYYERRGLLPDPRGSASGYRWYREEDVRRVRFIKRAQSLGFTLREIGELLELRAHSGRACTEVQEVARARLAELDTRLREMRAMKRALTRLLDVCPGEVDRDACPILEYLEEEWGGAGRT